VDPGTIRRWLRQVDIDAGLQPGLITDLEAGVEAVAPPPGRRPSVPRLAWLLVREPGTLNDRDLGLLTRLQAACPSAATAYPVLQTIRRIIRERRRTGSKASWRLRPTPACRNW
jgi:hypothetical protein